MTKLNNDQNSHSPLLHLLSAGGEGHCDVLPSFAGFSLAWCLTAKLSPALLEHCLPLVLCTDTQTPQLPVFKKKKKK